MGLPLEGERERGTMPRGSPSEGELVTLKGTTPGGLEGDLPWESGILGERRTSSTKSTRRCKNGARCGVVVVA